jgi:hypothetical protein
MISCGYSLVNPAVLAVTELDEEHRGLRSIRKSRTSLSTAREYSMIRGSTEGVRPFISDVESAGR